MINKLINNNLNWFPEKGIGYYPVEEFPYNETYFNKYKGYAVTEMGKELNKSRIAFVSRHFTGKILDVGIGSGQFVFSRKGTFGYDVNPNGVALLKENNLFADLYKNEFEAITFWDSLEHIREPEKAIRQAKKFVFISIPIFEDVNDVLESKHFRKDEHYWYFTHIGLVNWFSRNDFSFVEVSFMETKLGRNNIFTYAFRRKND